MPTKRGPGPLPGLQECTDLNQGNQGQRRGLLGVTQHGLSPSLIKPQHLDLWNKDKSLPSWFRESWAALSIIVRTNLVGGHEPHQAQAGIIKAGVMTGWVTMTQQPKCQATYQLQTIILAKFLKEKKLRKGKSGVPVLNGARRAALGFPQGGRRGNHQIGTCSSVCTATRPSAWNGYSLASNAS